MEDTNTNTAQEGAAEQSAPATPDTTTEGAVGANEGSSEQAA